MVGAIVVLEREDDVDGSEKVEVDSPPVPAHLPAFAQVYDPIGQVEWIADETSADVSYHVHMIKLRWLPEKSRADRDVDVKTSQPADR